MKRTAVEPTKTVPVQHAAKPRDDTPRDKEFVGGMLFVGPRPGIRKVA